MLKLKQKKSKEPIWNAENWYSKIVPESTGMSKSKFRVARIEKYKLIKVVYLIKDFIMYLVLCVWKPYP